MKSSSAVYQPATVERRFSAIFNVSVASSIVESSTDRRRTRNNRVSPSCVSTITTASVSEKFELKNLEFALRRFRSSDSLSAALHQFEVLSSPQMYSSTVQLHHLIGQTIEFEQTDLASLRLRTDRYANTNDSLSITRAGANRSGAKFESVQRLRIRQHGQFDLQQHFDRQFVSRRFYVDLIERRNTLLCKYRWT